MKYGVNKMKISKKPYDCFNFFKVTFHLKGGQNFSVNCKDFEYKRDADKISDYGITGMYLYEDHLLTANPSEIAAITCKKVTNRFLNLFFQ